MSKEAILGTCMERMNQRARELTEALQKKDLIEDQFLKAFALRKEMRDKVLGETNWHKRMAKRVFAVFRGRESQILINEKWWIKYFEKLTQIQAEELNKIWISIELKNSLE